MHEINTHWTKLGRKTKCPKRTHTHRRIRYHLPMTLYHLYDGYCTMVAYNTVDLFIISNSKKNMSKYDPKKKNQLNTHPNSSAQESKKSIVKDHISNVWIVVDVATASSQEPHKKHWFCWHFMKLPTKKTASKDER